MFTDFFANYDRYERVLAPIQLSLFMLGMGATLTPRDFLNVVKRPQAVLVGAVCQFVITPMVALFIILVCGVNPGIAVGLILISAMPSGSLPKLFAYIGRGNFGLSASLDAIGTLISLITVPLFMQWFVAGYLPVQFDVPIRVVCQELFLFLVMPLIVGMVLARMLPRHRHRSQQWFFRIGAAILLLMIVGSVGSGRIQPGAYGWQAPALVIVFCLVTQQLSMIPLRVLGWPRANRLSIGLDVTMRNINLALAMLAIMRQALHDQQRLDATTKAVLDGVFWTILYYAGVAAVAGLVVALQFRYLDSESSRQVQPVAPTAAIPGRSDQVPAIDN